MNIFIAILAFLSAILILVLIHEFGHFFAAKLVKIKIERLSIGFGKPFWKYKSKNNIEYALAPILLGGFVKLDDKSFNSASTWRRLLIMLAGVFANILFAVIMFWLLFIIGIDSLKPVIGKITPNSIAREAGLKKGEEIKTIDERKVGDWQAVNIAVIYRIGDKDIMRVNNHNLDLSNWRIDQLNPDPLQSLGIEPYEPILPAIIGNISKNSYAMKMGLQINDQILAINGRSINDWKTLVTYIHEHPKQQVTFTIKREHKTIKLSGLIGSKLILKLQRQGYLGVMPTAINYPSSMLFKQKYPFYQAVFPAIKEVYVLLALNFIILIKLLTGKMSLYILGGSISIFNSSAIAFHAGLLAYISFLALFSVMLAFVNILPIPVLDGGHCVFLLIETLLGKPIPNQIQQIAMRIGALILTVLVFLSLGNDLLRLFL